MTQPSPAPSPMSLAGRDAFIAYVLAGLLAIDSVAIVLDGGDGLLVAFGFGGALALALSARFGNRVLVGFMAVVCAFSPVIIPLATACLVYGGYMMLRTMKAVNASSQPRRGT